MSQLQVQADPHITMLSSFTRAAETPYAPVPDRNAYPSSFTLDGSPELEHHLARSCRKIAAGTRGLIPASRLEAVLLGGGYGRGEGGVLNSPTGDRPYNDLEFYVCVRGNRHVNERRFGRALHVLGEILTPQVGVEVEFKITSLHELAATGISMFSYDLVMGHRWLIGEESLLDRCPHHREARAIPVMEATRLLMNRCSGLLFAAERLERPEFTAADADFVRRNVAKAELALGDALLVMSGQYHWQVRERHRRLKCLLTLDTLPCLPDIVQHHAAGVQFKLHPVRSDASRDQLAAEHETVSRLAEKLWLWIEQRRIHSPFESTRAYALSTLNKYRDSSPWRNVLLHVRKLGTRALLSDGVRRHPRERIFNTLTLLLWERATLGSPELLRFVQKELCTEATTFPELVQAYRELWAKVN